MADLAQAFSEVKSLPDSELQKSLASNGPIPGWLALGEMHERKRIRATTSSQDASKRPSMAEEYAGSMKPYAGEGSVPPPPMQAMPPQSGPPPVGGIAGLPSSQPMQPQGFAGGGIVGLARGGQVSPIEAYIRQQAAARGMDPETAVRVARSEGGLNDPFRQGESMLSYGREESYGPFQLHMRNGGVGVRALAAGIDPRKNWQGGIDYALAEAQNKGWGQWFGAAKAGIGNWQGIKNQGAGAYPQGGEPIAYTPTTTAVVPAATDPNAQVAATASDVAGKVADATETPEEGNPMLQYYMLQQLIAPQQQQVVAAPPPQAQQQRAPVDPRQFVQNPSYFMNRRGGYG